MPKIPEVISERVDDIPLLIQQVQHMNLPSLIDTHFTPHGNWSGLTPGELTAVWLSYILSEGDHRLNQVEDWIHTHLVTFQSCLVPTIRRLDGSDDRMAQLLDLFSDDVCWEQFEAACGQTLLRVYALDPQVSRVDTTTASGYGQVTSEGLFQFGHSKDHRADLPQVKINLATLDPLGLPLVTQVWSGERSDDPLYVPAIREVQACVHQTGLLFVGDSKMAALATRAYLHSSGDEYLMPLPLVQLSAKAIDQRLAPVWSHHQALTPIYRPATEPETPLEKIAAGFEWTEDLTDTVNDQVWQWTERRFLIRSVAYAEAQEKALHARLCKAQHALEALNQRGRGHKNYPTEQDLHAVAQALLTEHAVAELLRLTYAEQRVTRTVRAYGNRPERTETTRAYLVKVSVNTPALEQALQRLGWRVYATNRSKSKFSMAQAVDAYRHQYLHEHGFSRLKGRALALTPLYLADARRVVGLVRVLSLALRVLTLVEFVVRQQLHARHAKLSGVYASQSKRATTRPSTELLLHAFTGITLTLWRDGATWRTHLTTLSPPQQQILKLLKFPPTLYSRLEIQSQKLASKMSEP